MNAVEIRDVWKAYGSTSALKGVSIDVPQGFVVGLVGPNGAGKTTILRALLNLTRIDAGTMSVLGAEGAANEASTRDRIGFVHEESYLFEDMTALHHERICAAAYTRWNTNRFHELLETLEVPASARVKSFSKGMRMRLQLAMALSHEAELVIMDEPTSGLDPVARRELTNLVASEMERENRTFLFSTHITSDLDRIADYVIVLSHGEVVLSTDRTQIAEEFALCKGGREVIRNGRRELFEGIRENEFGFTALTRQRSAVAHACGDDVLTEPATIEDLVFHLTGGPHESALDS